MLPLFKRFTRFIFIFLASLAILVALYFGAAWILGNTAAHETRVRTAEQHIVIFVSSNGVHTDIVLPMKNAVFDWHSQIHPHDTAGGAQTQAEYVAIGWGDRGFYLDTPTWADLTARTAFNAAFGLSGSALHVSYLPQAPVLNENTAALYISESEYRQLLAQILPSFARDEHGRTRLIPQKSYAHNDAFYEANGRYSLFHTCNTWANERLKNSNLPAVKWTPFAHHIVQHYQQQKM